MLLLSLICVLVLGTAGVLLWVRLSGTDYLGMTEAGWTSVHDDRLVMGERIRVLEVAGAYQSATYLDERWADLVFPYHQLFEHGFDDWTGSDRPVAAAVLGGGGYALPKHLVAHHPELSRIDVVEIDPAIERIAHRYFFLDRLEQRYHAQSDGRLCLHIADAYQWLEETNHTYDLIFNDCFFGLDPDAELMAAQGAWLVHSRLTPGGIYLANVVSALEGPDAEPLYATIDALGKFFRYIWVYPCSPDAPGARDNNMVLASDLPHRHPRAWDWPTTREGDS